MKINRLNKIIFGLLSSLAISLVIFPVVAPVKVALAQGAPCYGLPKSGKAPLIEVGNTSPLVRLLRDSLVTNGYLAAEGASQTYDASLAQLVRAFQAANAIPVDADVGARTWNLLTRGSSCESALIGDERVTDTADPDNSDPSDTTEESTTTSGGDCDAGFEKSGPLCIPTTGRSSEGVASERDLAGLIRRIITTILTLSGVVAVAFIVVGGFLYIASAGNKNMATTGRTILTNAIIGLVIVLLAYTIVQVVVNTVTNNTVV